MKIIIIAVLALAISSEALYPLPVPESVTPSVVYGVPEESKPVVAPIKTEYAYAVASGPAPVAPVVAVKSAQPVSVVSYDSTVIHPAPASPILINSPSELHLPSEVTALVDGSVNPIHTVYSAPLPATPFVLPQSPIHVLPQDIVSPYYGYPSYDSYGYAFGYSGFYGQQLAYSAINIPSSSIVTVPGPAQVPFVEHKPIDVSYEYQLPQVAVVQPRPVVPHSVYGVPN